MRMTVGEWLLEFFWRNSDLLEACNKWGGVLMAIIGAVLAVPFAVRHGVGNAVTRVRSAAESVQSGVKGFIRWIRRQPKQGAANFSGGSKTTVQTHDPAVYTGDPWPDEGSSEEQHKWIRDELRRIERRHDDHVENNERVIRHLKGLHKGTSKTIEKMQSELKAQEATGITIDSIGILPILSGIILTGVPEELSQLGALGWGLFIAGCAITFRALRHSMRSGVWSEKLS